MVFEKISTLGLTNISGQGWGGMARMRAAPVSAGEKDARRKDVRQKERQRSEIRRQRRGVIRSLKEEVSGLRMLQFFDFDVSEPDGEVVVLEGDTAGVFNAETGHVLEFAVCDHIPPVVVPHRSGDGVDTIHKEF